MQKGDPQDADKTASPLSLSPISSSRHLDTWPDEWTCRKLFAARCKDVKCEGTPEQLEKFKMLISARFSLHSIKLSGAGVGAAFACDVRAVALNHIAKDASCAPVNIPAFDTRAGEGVRISGRTICQLAEKPKELNAVTTPLSGCSGRRGFPAADGP